MSKWSRGRGSSRTVSTVLKVGNWTGTLPFIFWLYIWDTSLKSPPTDSLTGQSPVPVLGRMTTTDPWWPLFFFLSPVRRRSLLCTILSSCDLPCSLILKNFSFSVDFLGRITLKCVCSGLCYVCVLYKLSGFLETGRSNHFEKRTCSD